MSEEMDAFDFGDNVETETFEQILEMDEGEDDGGHEFSRSIVFGFLDQAETTFQNMDEALEAQDLEKLSSLGHFLKGSSATLGFTKVKDECEKIQHFGHRKDETGVKDEPDDGVSLKRIDRSITEAKKAYAIVDDLMKRYYEQLEKA